eukprot:g8624.t1
MARWGEGDPRWLVENRTDGRNVNQWHWEEFNKIDWAKNRLSELLVGFNNELAIISQLKEVSGEASVMTRKGGKKVSTFDLKLVLEWKSKNADENVKGEIKIREFAVSNEPDEYEFEIVVNNSEQEIKDKFRKLWMNSKEQIVDLLEQFTEEFQQS